MMGLERIAKTVAAPPQTSVWDKILQDVEKLLNITREHRMQLNGLTHSLVGYNEEPPPETAQVPPDADFVSKLNYQLLELGGEQERVHLAITAIQEYSMGSQVVEPY